MDALTQALINQNKWLAGADETPSWVDNPPAPNNNLPDQTTALARQLMHEGSDYWVGLARQWIGQGTMLGAGDEAEAWLRSRGGNRSYEDLHAEIDGQNKQFFEENPGASMAAQLVGGMVVPGSLVAKPLQMASKLQNPLARALAKGTAYSATGATAGATYGHNTGTGEMGSEDRMSGAENGALAGALLGPAVPVAANAVGHSTKALANMLKGGYDKAVGGVNRGLDDIGAANQKIHALNKSDAAAGHSEKMAGMARSRELSGQKSALNKAHYDESLSAGHLKRAENMELQPMADRQHIQTIAREKARLEIASMSALQKGDMPEFTRINQRLDELDKSVGSLQGAGLGQQGAGLGQHSGDLGGALARQLKEGGPPRGHPRPNTSAQEGATAHPTTVSGPGSAAYQSPQPGSLEAVDEFLDFQRRNAAQSAAGKPADIVSQPPDFAKMAGDISNAQKTLANQLKNVGDQMPAATPYAAAPHHIQESERRIIEALKGDLGRASRPRNPLADLLKGATSGKKADIDATGSSVGVDWRAMEELRKLMEK